MTTKTTAKATDKPTSTLQWLAGQVEAYLVKNPAVTPAGFGWASVRDTGLVDRLRKGRDVTTRKLDALVRYMSNPNEKEQANGIETESKKAGRKKEVKQGHKPEAEGRRRHRA